MIPGSGAPGLRPAPRGGAFLRRAIHLDVRPVALQHFLADALDLAQIVDAAERAVLFTVCNDRLRAAQADALQLFRDRGGIRGVDVDRTGPDERRHERDDERLNRAAQLRWNDLGHGALLSVKELPGSALQDAAGSSAAERE